MTTTPEEKRAAERELDDTVRRLAPALECCDDGEVITAWMLVGHRAAPQEDGLSRYFHVFSGGTMPTHTALGLVRVEQLRLEGSGDDWDEA